MSTEKIVPHHPFKPDAGIVGNIVAKRAPQTDLDFHKIFEGRDDENFVGKTLKMTKYTASSTLVATGADVILFDRMGLVHTLRRGLFWGIPIIGGGIAYTAVVCFAASLRKKDGELNHFFGGVAAGTVLGAQRQNFTMGMLTGLGLGLLGSVYKISKQDGFDLFPPWPNVERGYTNAHKMDYTLWKDIPGHWVRELPPSEK